MNIEETNEHLEGRIKNMEEYKNEMVKRTDQRNNAKRLEKIKEGKIKIAWKINDSEYAEDVLKGDEEECEKNDNARRLEEIMEGKVEVSEGDIENIPEVIKDVLKRSLNISMWSM